MRVKGDTAQRSKEKTGLEEYYAVDGWISSWCAVMDEDHKPYTTKSTKKTIQYEAW